MNTFEATKSLSASANQWDIARHSREAGEFMKLGIQQRWRVNVLGRAPIPKKPVRLGNWLIVPSEQDSSEIPARALNRIQSIFASGLRPKGFVLVHEAPKLLPASDQDDSTTVLAPPFTIFGVPWRKVVIGAFVIGGILLSLIAGAIFLVVSAMAVATSLALPATLVAGAVLVDPILIAITEDGFWIEIDRWVN